MVAKKVGSKPTHKHEKVVSREPAERRPTLSFHSDEFFHHTKNELWYLGIGLLLIAGVIGSIYARNYLFALVVITGGIAIFRLANLKPGTRRVEISNRGVTWGDDAIPFHQIKAFFLSAHHDQVVVYLERLNMAPVLHFTVPEEQLDQVLDVLAQNLPMHHHKDEPIGDKLGKWLKI